MEIVTLKERNWLDLKAVRLQALVDSPNAFCATYQKTAEFSDEEWRKRASGEHGCQFIMAYESLEPVGMLGAAYDGEYCELISMWVNPRLRAKGIGKALVKALVKYAVENGYRGVYLEVSAANKPALKLYEQCGFTDIGVSGVMAKDKSVKLHKMVCNLF